jgi:hypothetical protein
MGKKYVGCWVLCHFCMLGCISAIVMECASVRNCRALGVCTVGTLGCLFCRFMEAALDLPSGEERHVTFLSVAGLCRLSTVT